MTDKVTVDFPQVDPEQAARLMAHHLQIAAALFEALPEPFSTHDLLLHYEFELLGYGSAHYHPTPALIAGRAFIEAICKHYLELDKEIG